MIPQNELDFIAAVRGNAVILEKWEAEAAAVRKLAGKVGGRVHQIEVDSEQIRKSSLRDALARGLYDEADQIDIRIREAVATAQGALQPFFEAPPVEVDWEEPCVVAAVPLPFVEGHVHEMRKTVHDHVTHGTGEKALVKRWECSCNWVTSLKQNQGPENFGHVAAGFWKGGQVPEGFVPRLDLGEQDEDTVAAKTQKPTRDLQSASGCWGDECDGAHSGWCLHTPGGGAEPAESDDE